jgi:hypothetical protein
MNEELRVHFGRKSIIMQNQDEIALEADMQLVITILQFLCKYYLSIESNSLVRLLLKFVGISGAIRTCLILSNLIKSYCISVCALCSLIKFHDSWAPDECGRTAKNKTKSPIKKIKS